MLTALALIGGGHWWVSGQATQPETVNQTRFLMDTTVDIRAIGADASTAVDEAFREMQRIEALFSRYVDNSDISRINAEAGQWVSVSAEVVELLQRSIKYGNLTKGSFDVTIGPLVTLWGFGTDQRQVPANEALQNAMAHVDYTAIALDPNQRLVKIPEGFMLDLGGVAKGYAVDRGADVLRERGIEHGLINAGGDISVVGTRDTEGSPWRVGIQDPAEPSRVMAVVELMDATVVTSGDYQRYFEVDGTRFHHIIDPATGFPADELTSVTVVAPTAADGDALSTALFILGKPASIQLLEQLPDIEAVIVSKDGTVWISPGLQARFRFL